MIIAGLNMSYTFETRANIPAQWQHFVPHIGKIPGQIGTTSYGVCWNNRPGIGFDYLSGVEVRDVATLPAEFVHVRLLARQCAVFNHREHVSSIGKTIDTIWNQWVPQSGLKIADAPCFERYTGEFNPQTGMGGMQIWIPLDA
jgi:AraC family transcriptional regulator